MPGDYRHLPVDLMDPADCQAKLGGTAGRALGVTHVFHMAYINRAEWDDLIAPNLSLLNNRWTRWSRRRPRSITST